MSREEEENNSLSLILCSLSTEWEGNMNRHCGWRKLAVWLLNCCLFLNLVLLWVKRMTIEMSFTHVFVHTTRLRISPEHDMFSISVKIKSEVWKKQCTHVSKKKKKKKLSKCFIKSWPQMYWSEVSLNTWTTPQNQETAVKNEETDTSVTFCLICIYNVLIPKMQGSIQFK